MKLPPDYHMHTPLCRHAEGEPVEYARRAMELGLSEIGFSDHAPLARDDFDDWRMSGSQLREYVEKVQRARREFPQLTIRLALEVDYLPGQEEWIQTLAAQQPWDYLIGSVHYVTDDWAIDNPHQISKWQDQEVFQVWSAYFDRLTQAAATGLFNIIGHADLPKKFGHRPEQDCAPLYRQLLSAAKQQGCAIELNTAGLRKDCREIYPARELLAAAFTAGVPITFGSDAHRPEEVGMDFAVAVQQARAVGYRETLQFAGRKAERIPL